MAEKLKNSPVSSDISGSGPTINAPEIEDLSSLRATVRAISSVDQIYRICEAMFAPDSERNYKNGIIADQYNDSPPFPVQELKNKGQKFRHNFSTCFLSGILDQTIGAPIDVIDQAQYLTSAALPSEDDPDGSKTEAYRLEFTKLVRGWEGWRTHIYNIAQEDVVFGYAAAVCDDPDDWRPEECRQDEFGVPDNTGQHASKAQFFGRRKSFQIHELVEKLKNTTNAKLAGWNIEACVESLNEAMPEDRATGGETGAAPTSRTIVDLVRDGNSGAAHDPKARTVDVYILLAVEADGKVSKYIVTQKGHKSLYENEDEFEKLSDIIVFYSLAPGSGTLYSSKGGGRRLVNIAKSAERARNKSADNCYIGGLVWMKTDKGMVAVSLKVFDQFGIIESGADVVTEGIPDRSEAYDKLDERLERYAGQSFGAYIPMKPGQDQRERTAHEAVIEAQRENITRANWLKRFLGQFKDEITMIAKRVGDPDTSDEKAKEFQQLLETKHGITKEMLKKLSDQPAGDLVQNLTAQTTQALIQSAPLMLQSPFFDKYKVQYELSVRTIGKELTDKLMFRNGIDPADEAANIRMQILENAAIRSGESPNIAPSHDNHKIHSKVVIGDLKRAEPIVTKRVQDGTIEPQVLDNIQTAIKHGEAHVAEGMNQAGRMGNADDQQELAQHQQFYTDMQGKLDAALKFLMEKKQAAEAGQPPQQQQQGAPAPNQPEGPGQGGGLSEKILTAWIGQYDKLSPEAKGALERVSGLAAFEQKPQAPGMTANPSLTQ